MQPRKSERHPRFISREAERLFLSPEERDSFIKCLLNPPHLDPHIFWIRERPESIPFATQRSDPELIEGVDRLPQGIHPGADPLHEKGFYYCIDSSSVFAASILKVIPRDGGTVLDLCAAPGGKGIIAWRLLSPDWLIFNEVSRKRRSALISNLERCGIHPAGVTGLDPGILAREIPGVADVVIVDAPCSGQSLLVKGVRNPGCFHPSTIKKNVGRQRRILANTSRLVAPGGYLAYMTCTYSVEENEGILEWFLSQFTDFESVSIPHLKPYQSHLSQLPCYRQWPHRHPVSSGSFTALVRSGRLPSGKPLRPDLPYLWTSRAE